MTLGSRLVERVLALPPAVTRSVRHHSGIAVRARDGVILRTDVYSPDLPGLPAVLIRTPYGRGGVIGLVTGRVLAERGFHVVTQSCRGTFGSGGAFDPLRHERDDGLDTLEWIERQPWFNGTLFTYGPSYVGFTQWAIADAERPAISGMLTSVTASSFRDSTYAGGSFSLDTILTWATLVGNQGGSLLSFVIKQNRSRSRLLNAWKHLPLTGTDTIAAGTEIAFFQDWLTNAADDGYWTERVHDHRVPAVTAPVCMVGGWYDIFLPWQLADYAAMRAAGQSPRLVIGPWTHASRELFARSMREGIDWFRAHSGASSEPRTKIKPVEVYVDGAREWRTYDAWPPPSRTAEWFLRPGRALALGPMATVPAGSVPDGSVPAGSVPAGPGPDGPGPDGSVPAGSGPDRFRYDPADPTPSVGGALFAGDGGKRDNRGVEARPDVLVYTSEPLDADLDVIGEVSATIRLRSSSPHFDIFVRVCDVRPDGRSENVCDGLTRVGNGIEPGNEPRTGAGTDAGVVRTVDVALWPAAYRFRAGHRIRVQVAGGAHPRWARNTGTGEPLASASELRPVDHVVMLDEANPSLIRLPVTRLP